tara:strand:+ start:258 stop:500 length:243 start_codon:yes stop_codon:yes gene_type:complete
MFYLIYIGVADHGIPSAYRNAQSSADTSFEIGFWRGQRNYRASPCSISNPVRRRSFIFYFRQNSHCFSVMRAAVFEQIRE